MWTVAQLKPKQVERAIHNLKRQHFTVFNPVITVKRVIRNRVVRLPEPVFPSYVFIELADGQRWIPINSTFGVKRLLTRQTDRSEYREPAVIADAFIAGLQRCSRHDGKDGWRLEPGTAIRIIRGPLSGRTAIVTWSGAERVRFLLNLLNRDLEVEIAVEDVAPSEPRSSAYRTNCGTP